MSSVKQKLSIKRLKKKMSGFEEGLSNKDVAEMYGAPRNTISMWVKNKLKYFTTLEQSLNKRKKL